MTSRALAPNLLTHLGNGRSPMCAASPRPNPCRIRSIRNLLGLQYGLLPSSGAKCTHGRWVFVVRDCVYHAISVRGGTSLTGSSRRCLRAPTGNRGMHCGSSASKPSGGEAPHRRRSTGHQAQFWRSASQALLHWPPCSVEAKRHTGDAPLAIKLNGAEAPHRRHSTGHQAQWRRSAS